MDTTAKQDTPWWLYTVIAVALYLAVRIHQDDLYQQIFRIVGKGAGITAFVTLVTFAMASVFGLLLAIGSLSRFLFFRQISRLYIEVVRGIPILVILFYIAFVGAPVMVGLINAVLEPLNIEPLKIRDISLLWRSVIALTIGYSAFIAEVFRAGIQAIEAGQIEAAKSLGLGNWHRFRFIVFPQAIRTILPPLGNDFIALDRKSVV